MRDWLARTAQAAQEMAEAEADPQRSANLREIAAMNFRLVSAPPATFREACQWILWYDMAARMYNGSGSLGRLDVLLWPFYQRESAAGTLTDEEATFHLACLLLRDTAYLQLGGPDADGCDVTRPGFVPGARSRPPSAHPGQRRRGGRRGCGPQPPPPRRGDLVRG